MPAVARIDPKTVFTPEEWSRLTSRSSWRGMWLVAHAWGTIAGSIALVTLWPNPLTWLVAVMIVGTRQLGLAILMHEAAHGGLHANKRVNEFVGQWLCAMRGHDSVLHFEGNRVMMRCTSCGHDSPGWLGPGVPGGDGPDRGLLRTA